MSSHFPDGGGKHKLGRIVGENLGGFLVISGALQSPFLAADLYNVAWHDAAYGIHLALLLLVVVSSSVNSIVLGSWLRQSRKLR